VTVVAGVHDIPRGAAGVDYALSRRRSKDTHSKDVHGTINSRERSTHTPRLLDIGLRHEQLAPCLSDGVMPNIS
jgi:hypothetical protein